jgi:hypothetical protein
LEQDDSTFYEPVLGHNPVAAIAVLALSTVTLAPTPQLHSLPRPEVTTSVTNPLPNSEDWRVELKARYKAMPETAWFKAAHEGCSLGESLKIS